MTLGPCDSNTVVSCCRPIVPTSNPQPTAPYRFFAVVVVGVLVVIIFVIVVFIIVLVIVVLIIVTVVVVIFFIVVVVQNVCTYAQFLFVVGQSCCPL